MILALNIRCQPFALVLIVLLGGCDIVDRIPPILRPPEVPTQSPTAAAPAQSPAIAQMESQVRQQINAIRRQRGLTELSNNEKLAQVARNYSRRMAEENFFAHVSPQGDTLSDRIKAAGIFYFMVGENLFTSTNISQPVPAAIQGWMQSPGHRENILRREFRQTGVGIWQEGTQYYFTQLFLL